MSRLFRRTVTAVVIIVLSSGAGFRVVDASGQAPSQAAVANGLSPSGLAQLNALLAEKAALTPTQRKINSRLLHAKRQLTGETSVTTMNVALPLTAGGKVQLELRAEVTDRLLTALGGLGADIVATQVSGRSVLVDADLLQIEQVAALPDVHFVQPKPGYMISGFREADPSDLHDGVSGTIRALRARKLLGRAAVIDSVRAAFGQGFVTNTGSVTSQGDVTHKAATARAIYGVDGTGIKVGVLSDGVTSLATSQATGNLGAVTVLPGQTGNGDEGTAMLEIIHDLAPGAQLFFATAFSTPAQFAQNIRDLQTAGCQIILDDVLYFIESPFQDGQAPAVISPTNGGVIAQAVKDVTAAGALYFSSAANSGNRDGGTSGTWEGDFVDGGATAVDPAGAGNLHNFGSATFDVVTATTGPFVSIHWSDPLGASGNDYDLFRLNSTGTAVLDSSTDTQDGTADPIEMMGAANAGDRIVIVKRTGAAGRFLHLDTNRGRLNASTAGSTHGHADTTSPTSFSVAAAPAATAFTAGAPTGPFPNPFNAGSLLEPFSSDGPRHIFFTSTGDAITQGNVSSTGGQILQKPDITAADGVSVSGAGGFPTTFFGTSAAAPHAAAIAALAWSANLPMPSSQVRSALLGSAIDVLTAGTDRDSGAGIVMADTSVAAVSLPPTITTPPLSQTIAANTPATLSVVASSLPALTYQWHLGQTGVLNPIPGATASVFVTPSLDGLAQYWVRVSNVSGSADSSTATVSVAFTDATQSFTDATLTTGVTSVRAVHIEELRTRINALHIAAGLGAVQWTDEPLAAQTTVIKAVHITELRAALIAVYTARALTPPTFSALAAGTSIRAAQISELRNAVTAVE